MSESYVAHVFAPENEAYGWAAVGDELARWFPGAAAGASQQYDGLIVVLADGYEIGVVAEHDVSGLAGRFLHGDESAETLPDDVAERLRGALAACTLRVEVRGVNDMGNATDHFSDWAEATGVVEEAVRGTITIDATELEYAPRRSSAARRRGQPVT